MNNHILNGFVKRAEAFGFTKEEAVNCFFKLALSEQMKLDINNRFLGGLNNVTSKVIPGFKPFKVTPPEKPSVIDTLNPKNNINSTTTALKGIK